jgi:hypothetical protein
MSSGVNRSFSNALSWCATEREVHVVRSHEVRSIREFANKGLEPVELILCEGLSPESHRIVGLRTLTSDRMRRTHYQMSNMSQLYIYFCKPHYQPYWLCKMLPNSATPVTPIQDNLQSALDTLITWLQGEEFKVAKKDEDVRVPEDDIPQGIPPQLVNEMCLTRKVRQCP